MPDLTIGGRGYHFDGDLGRWMDLIDTWYSEDFPAADKRDAYLTYLHAITYEYGLLARARWSTFLLGRGNAKKRELSGLWQRFVDALPTGPLPPGGASGDVLRRSAESLFDPMGYLAKNVSEDDIQRWAKDCRRRVTHRVAAGNTRLDPL